MSASELSQQQVLTGEVVELTQEGVEFIKARPNIYSADSKPVAARARDWGGLTVFNLWVGIIVSILVYQLTSGLIVEGMTALQALFTVVLGHTLVMVFAIIFGHFGTKYGVNYTMLSRLVFGVKGAFIPAFVRAFLGVFWFGVQAWIGGQALNAIFERLIPAWSSLGSNALYISFILFWAINVLIALFGNKGVKYLENIAAPGLIVLALIVIAWGFSQADYSFTHLLSCEVLQPGRADKSFDELFFPALSAMIAFDGGIALSMADFTRNCRSQRAQIAGQLTAAPLTTLFIAFVGICGTAGGYLAFGEAIWEPTALIAHFDSTLVVVLFSLFVTMAVLTTNVSGNLMPATNVLSTLMNARLSYKVCALIAAVLALLTQPWNALSSAHVYIFYVCGYLGALLGPISGIYLAAYLFEHRGHVSLVDLFCNHPEGRYFYHKGYNVYAILIFIVVSIIIFASSASTTFSVIFDNSYVIGSALTFVPYAIYTALASPLRHASIGEVM